MNFVGRVEELDLLDIRRDGLGGGDASVVLVRGTPGVGKTALLTAFCERSERLHGVKTSMVTCAQRAEEPFAPFRRLVREIVDPDEAAVPAKRGRKYASAAARAMLELGPEFASLIFPPAGLAAKVGIVGTRVLRETGVADARKSGRSLDYRYSDREHFSDFVEFFRTMDPETPHIIVIDDLHWADEASIALFGRLSASLRQGSLTPILLIGSYRGHEVSANLDHPLRSALHQVRREWGEVVIDMTPDDDDELDFEFTRQLIDAYAPNALDEAFARKLFESTHGIPLHVLDVLEAMRITGDVFVDDGVLVARPDLCWDHVPVRFDAALAERIDRLSPEANGLLRFASVQGIEFSADVIAVARRHDLDHVLPILTDQLDTSHDLVEDLGRSNSDPVVYEFQFRHPEYQRFVYEGSTKSTRERAHEKIALSLIEVYEGAESEVALDIANHFMKAGQPGLAGPWYLKTATSARDAQAFPDARNIALAGLRDPDRLDPSVEAELQFLAGVTTQSLGRYSEATAHLERALELAGELDSRVFGAGAMVWRGINAWRLDDDSAAYDLLSQALTETQELGDREMEVRAMRGLGILGRKRGDANRALLWYERAMAIAQDLGDGPLITSILNNSASVHTHLRGDFEKAQELYAEALDIAQTAGNRSGEAMYLGNLADVTSRLGDYQKAIRFAECGVLVCQEVGNRRRESLMCRRLGDAYRRLGEPVSAASAYREYIAIASHMQSGQASDMRSRIGLALATISSGGDMDTALTEAATAHALYAESGREWLWNTVLDPSSSYAVILAASGDSEGALAVLEPEGQLIPSGSDPWWLVWQRSLSSTVRAVLTDVASDRERAIQRLRLASADADADGVLEDARTLVEMLKPIATNRDFIVRVDAVLSSPPQRLPASRALHNDQRRLDEYASRYRQALRQSRLEPYWTALGGAAARTVAIETAAAGHTPVFEYRPVPDDYEAPLLELLADLDPARSVWESLLYESTEDHIDILTATRSGDSGQLADASTAAFGVPTPHLVREARTMLGAVAASNGEPDVASSEDAASIMELTLANAGLRSWTVEVSSNMNALMSVSSASDTIRIRRNARFAANDLKRLIVHEIGTHVLRAENGRRQPLALLSMGLGRNAATEEGLAAHNEEQAGVADPSTRRKYALRVVAADAALRYGFAEVYEEMACHTTPDEAFDITMRAKRGLSDPSQPGGFIKDHVYLEGLLQVRDAIEIDPGVYSLLMAAKVPLRLIPTLEELKAEGLLVEPYLLPADLLE